VDVDECADSELNKCEGNTRCENKQLDGYDCTECPEGEEANDDHTACISTDPCLKDPCGDKPNTICKKKLGLNFDCECQPGFKKYPQRDEDNDVCEKPKTCPDPADGCGPNQHCEVDTRINAFGCPCNKNYLLDGSKCVLAKHVCEINNGGCHENSKCVKAGDEDDLTKFNCQCKDGFKENEDKICIAVKTCDDLNCADHEKCEAGADKKSDASCVKRCPDEKTEWKDDKCACKAGVFDAEVQSCIYNVEEEQAIISCKDGSMPEGKKCIASPNIDEGGTVPTTIFIVGAIILVVIIVAVILYLNKNKPQSSNSTPPERAPLNQQSHA